MKWLKFTSATAVVVVAGVIASLRFGDVALKEAQEKIDTLEHEKAQLRSFAERLSASRRVAQVDVVRQRTDVRGRPVSTLLWQEIGADGTLGKPVAVEAVGELVYFEALVIKFEPAYVGQGDEVRGTSLAMFRRVFGEAQSPDSVPELDRVARPVLEETRDAESLQAELWERFWDLVDDKELARRYGVRVAQIEAPAVPLEAGELWEVSLDAAGGLNLRKLGVRKPLEPILVDTPASSTP